MGDVVSLRDATPTPDRSQVWTCTCESQTWFCLEDGRVICTQCRSESNVITVTRRDPTANSGGSQS